jgi:HEAT repeat protein
VRFGVATGRIDPRQLMSLMTHRDLRVRTEAARALGESGRLAAVEPLLAIGSSEAKEAVRAIQARLGGQRGGLAVMEERAEVGQLSVADRAAGALSIAAKRKA